MARYFVCGPGVRGGLIGASQNSGKCSKFFLQIPLHPGRHRHSGIKLNYPAAHFSMSRCSQTSTSNQNEQKSNENKTPGLIKGLFYLTKIYDFLTYPIYTVLQKPGAKMAVHNSIKAKRSSDKPNEWHSVLPRAPDSLKMQRLGMDTLEKLFDYAVVEYGPQKCLGSRPIVSQEEIAIGGGQTLKKQELGDYQWKSYKEVNDLTTTLSRNMRTKLGLKSRETIAVFADTREEWLMTAFAAFKTNLAIATIFTALADDGIVHAVNETEVTSLFTSEDLMPRVYNLFEKMPLLKNVVYMDKPGSGFQLDKTKVPRHVAVQSLSSLFEPSMTSDDAPNEKPGPNDTAIIMYTSGSTGMPKGVILSHFNSISVIMGCADALNSVQQPNGTENEIYCAFLPLAHILELTAEAKSLLHGRQIGYGSALTLTDASPGLKKGTKGDATVLKPTNMGTVPLILERITKTVETGLKERGGMVPHLFKFFVDYKLNWTRRGYETPLVDKIFFKKIKNLLGGRLRLMICGGAPLAPQSQDLLRTILCTKLVVGYGLTETSGCASSCIPEDMTVGRAGSPIAGSIFRLVDWEEGGYHVTDKPYPRGELHVGGDSIAMGYFKRPENQDFFQENGMRWMKTGDIVEIHEDGVIKIIDRKKDLVKLSSGEFISLGKIESVLKTCPLIENICVYANSLTPFAVAVIVPSKIELENLAKKLELTADALSNYPKLCQDVQIVEKFLNEIQVHSKQSGLDKREIPRAIYLTPGLWTPQNGLVTASFKVKRTNIHTQFRQQLDQMAKQK